MPTQTHKQRPAQERAEAPQDTAVKERTDEQQELIDFSDELLADIEDALQGLDQNLAVEFEQKGGE